MTAAYRVPTDTIPAICAQFKEHTILLGGEGARDLAALLGSQFGPPAHLFFGFFIFNSSAVVFPREAVDDRGATYGGLEAFDWIVRRGQRFPRSDVIGVRSDGKPAEMLLRELDLALPPQVYAAPDAYGFPGRRVEAAFQMVADLPAALAPGGDFPPRLSNSVPTYMLHRQTFGQQSLKLIQQVLDTKDPDPTVPAG